MEKKEWSEPELIVLVRSKPEEAVLGLCKGGIIDGPGVNVSHCTVYYSEMSCSQCNNEAFS